MRIQRSCRRPRDGTDRQTLPPEDHGTESIPFQNGLKSVLQGPHDKKIILLFRPRLPPVAPLLGRLHDQLRAHHVIAAPGCLPHLDAQSVVVVLLSKSAQVDGGRGGGLPLDDFAAWEATGLDAVLAREGTVLPMLLDAAGMPTHTTIPEPFRKIAFRHALPIRCGEELDRDVGRLISDLEVHLKYSPGKLYAWDNWLLPIGASGAIICSPFLVLWLLDAWYWNYGYETAARYREACWWLTWFGPALLGAFLFLAAAGIVYRRYRRRAMLRAEHFQTGKGELPSAENRWLNAAQVMAWASIGWGWWAGALSVALLVPLSPAAVVSLCRLALRARRW